MHTSEIVDLVVIDRFWAGDAWLPAARGDISCALLGNRLPSLEEIELFLVDSLH